ncbi:DUF1294 domain-containing protein [Neorhizobium sp. NPDC001467]|uniref:DUF1294 domain-containing protein n=1 Tax=Neorhizobium sp. NPDC001467 TaxID=3390595 RepID=UPI003D00FF59
MQLGQSFTLFLIYLLLNVVVFCVYWWDKQAAIEGEWRVREDTLLALAFFGGSLGAVTAQQLLRHKTRKEPFRSSLRMILAFHIAAGLFWLLAPAGTLMAVLSLFK